MTMTPKATKAATLPRIRQLLTYYNDGTLPRLGQHEVHPNLARGSRENYLYFTLPACINFQRSSPALWAAALKTYEDPETQYVFLPEHVAETPIDKVRADLLRHKLALQPNKHTLIWTTIARSLHEFYENDPRRVIQEAGNDAEHLVRLLQSTQRARFPYLCGRKLSNYWPFMLSNFTDLQLKNSNALSIIPDTHVIQSTVHLGLGPIGITPERVENIWCELLSGSGITPVQMHPVLWNWSRNNFQPSV